MTGLGYQEERDVRRSEREGLRYADPRNGRRSRLLDEFIARPPRIMLIKQHRETASKGSGDFVPVEVLNRRTRLEEAVGDSIIGVKEDQIGLSVRPLK